MVFASNKRVCVRIELVSGVRIEHSTGVLIELASIVRIEQVTGVLIELASGVLMSQYQFSPR